MCNPAAPAPPAPTPQDIYAHTRVSAETLFSCFLAAVESLARDQKIAKTQPQMLAEYAAHFPKWQNQPGYIHDSKEAEALLKLVGFMNPIAYVRTPGETVMRFDTRKGAFVFTKTFYDEHGNLSDLSHALRLLEANRRGLILMNPRRSPAPGTIECYSWSEFVKWRAIVASLV
jgi:hypothetical protein